MMRSLHLCTHVGIMYLLLSGALSFLRKMSVFFATLPLLSVCLSVISFWTTQSTSTDPCSNQKSKKMKEFDFSPQWSTSLFPSSSLIPVFSVSLQLSIHYQSREQMLSVQLPCSIALCASPLLPPSVPRPSSLRPSRGSHLFSTQRG